MGTPEDSSLDELARRVSAARAATEARGETFYQGASRVHLAAFPPRERWDDWVELSSRAWPARAERHYMLVPTTCFNCESACGLLAYVDRDTGQVRKFEGNPEHPGSRGRNCAKGPATINQVTDPDRILYPMKRSGPRGGGRWERISWDEALDALAARIRAAITEQRHNEIMVHIGRPGEDGYTERVLASWGVDGHNSHTNVCSSGGRTGFQFWMGIDRPSPDHAHAKVIYLISAHLESGHYFNPHAQRITEARASGAKVIVLDTRLSNTATHADYWLSPQPGSEAAINLAIANHLIQTRGYDREFVRALVELGRIPDGAPPRNAGYLRGVRGDPGRAVRGLHLRIRGGRVGHRYGRARGGRLGGGRRGEPVRVPLVAVGGRGQPRRLAGVPHAVPHLRAARRGGHRGRDVPERVEQVRAAADPRAAAPGRVAGAVLAAGVPAGPERDVVPAAALPRRGPRAAGHLLHPGLQPGVDQPRRAELDGGPVRRGARSAASSR